jgi:hypothetical protein
MQIIGAKHTHNLGGNGLVLVSDEFVDELIVNQDESFICSQRDLICQVELEQAFDSPQQHSEVRTGIGAADSRTVLVYTQRRFLIQEIVNEVLKEFLANHVSSGHCALP